MTQPDTHGAPIPPRRSVLAGGAGAALGISTLALPSAFAAASTGGGGSGSVAAVAGAPDLTGTTTLAYWTLDESKGAADVKDDTVAPGAFSVGNGWPAPASQFKYPFWASNTSNQPSNDALSLDLDDEPPYVAWSITTDAAVQLAAFGLPRAVLGLTDDKLTLTFRCSIDDYATTIREVTAEGRSGAAGGQYNLLVNLEGLSFIPAGTTFELRMYLHGGTLGMTYFNAETIGSGTDYPAYETGRDEDQAEWRGFSHVQAFLGTAI